MDVLQKAAVFVLTFGIALYFFKDGTFAPESVRGKRVLITGASSGIGAATAYRYASLGAHVFITARREALLQQVTNRCQQLSPNEARSGYLAVDLSEEGSEQAVIKAAVDFLGGLDHVILNHCHITYARDIWRGTQQNMTDLKSLMKINAFSHINLASYAMPYVEKSRGGFGVISSMYGKRPYAKAIHYVTSKHAIDGFFATLREEYIMQRVNVSITIFTFGYIQVERMISGTSGLAQKCLSQGQDIQTCLDDLGLPRAEEAAEVIVNSVTLRKTNVFWPPQQWTLYHIFKYLLVT